VVRVDLAAQSGKVNMTLLCRGAAPNRCFRKGLVSPFVIHRQNGIGGMEAWVKTRKLGVSH
jgi:hypothetical protein